MAFLRPIGLESNEREALQPALSEAMFACSGWRSGSALFVSLRLALNVILSGGFTRRQA